MTYAPPEIKREDCFYPNCSGYLEVPFCCKDPQAAPALKAVLASIYVKPEQKPISTNDHLCAMLRQVHDVLACTALPMKRKWVGLTEDDLSETYNDLYTQYTRDDVNIADFILIARTIEAKLKELNT